MKTPERMLLVKWTDATMFEGWRKTEDLLSFEMESCSTVGFELPRSDKNILWLAMTTTGHHLGEVLAIPRKWIKEIKVLK